MSDKLTLTYFLNPSDLVCPGCNRLFVAEIVFILLSCVIICPDQCRAVQENSHLSAVYSLLLRSSPPVSSTCTILQNPGFEQGSTGWNIYGENTLVSDAYMDSKAIKIKNAVIQQTSQQLSGIPETYQFTGYYKTVGSIDEIYVGMTFFDENQQELLGKMLFLSASEDYAQFFINATTTAEVQTIKVWVSSDNVDIILDHLQLSPSACYDYQVASALPPGGLSAEQVPQFVVMAFDDNTKADGINWAIDLFADKYNYDGSEVAASFYMNTEGLHRWVEDDPETLLPAIQLLESTIHEIGNHTDNHHSNLYNVDVDVFFKNIKELDTSSWQERVSAANSDLLAFAEVPTAEIKGFRAPYLYYTHNSMSAIGANNFLYDCSIEEGFASEFDGTNMRWPYQLNGGSPGHTESWQGSHYNSDRIDLLGTDDLWSLPNYALMFPKDDECAAYGITVGLWDRLLVNMPYLDARKITGLDYNLLHLGKINKAEYLGILKYNLDLRLKGNRAPLMVSAHTQYYTGNWANDNAPNITKEEMREVLSEFVDYALTHEAVRMKKGVDVIKWCENSQPLP